MSLTVYIFIDFTGQRIPSGCVLVCENKSLSVSVTVSIGMCAVAYIYACTACVRTHTPTSTAHEVAEQLNVFI